MSYCARIRFHLAHGLHINQPSQELTLHDPLHGKDVTLRSIEGEAPISEAQKLALVIKSYDSEAEAWEAAERWQSALRKAFARANIGADFGGHGPTGVATEYGLKM